MRRRAYLRAIGTGATVAIAGCGAQNEGTQADDAAGGTETGTPTTEGGTATTTGGGTTTQQAPNEVAMITEGNNNLFDPVGLFVEPGETITWVNESGTHSSTAYTTNNPQSEVRRIPEGANGWNSDIMTEQGAEFTHTFDTPGTYDYYCIPHKSLGMVARLVVGEPSGLGDNPPDGPVPSEQTIVEQGVVTQNDFNP